jgi:LacI family transcriptional regulator
MATIRDVARASGVSTATVSNVLNARQDKVSPETRERVLAAVRQLKYRPPASDFRRAVVRNRNVGLVIAFDESRPSPGSDLFVTSEFFQRIVDGMLHAASECLWSITMFVQPMLEHTDSAMRRYVDGRCEGALLLAPSIESPILDAFISRGFPVVLVSAGTSNTLASSVDVANEEAARQIVRHLVALGHRRILHLRGPYSASSAMERARGFQDEMLLLGLDGTEASLRTGAYDYQSGFDLSIQVLKQPKENRPTAIFCANDVMAFGAVDAAHSLGVRVPEDLSIVGFDDDSTAQFRSPSLTTYRQPLRSIGEKAVRLVIESVSRRDTSHRKVVFPGELIVRESTAPPGDRR